MYGYLVASCISHVWSTMCLVEERAERFLRQACSTFVQQRSAQQVVDEFLHRMTVTISNYAIYQAQKTVSQCCV